YAHARAGLQVGVCRGLPEEKGLAGTGLTLVITAPIASAQPPRRVARVGAAATTVVAASQCAEASLRGSGARPNRRGDTFYRLRSGLRDGERLRLAFHDLRTRPCATARVRWWTILDLNQ